MLILQRETFLHNEKKSKTLITLLLVAFIIIYTIYISIFSEKYLLIRNEDPLAMVNLLFPSFNILIVSYIIVCLVLYSKFESKIVHVLLLIPFGIMLWWSPYFLSGFSRYLDSLWHSGISMYMPTILGGTTVTYAEYATEYPGSFIINFVLMKVCGIDVFAYSRIFYPLLSISLTIFLFYTFLLKISNPSSAFIGTILGIVGLHYVELYPSPHSFGIILGLSALILFILNGRIKRSLLLFFVTSLVLVISHPLTPIILVSFMIALFIANKPLKLFRASLTNPPILVVIIEWLGWAFLHSEMILGRPLALSIVKILNLEVATSKVISPVGCIFPEFSLMRTVSLLSYVIITGGFVVWFLYKRTQWKPQQRALFTMTLFAITLSIMFGISISAYMRERGLFFFTLSASGFIGFNLHLSKPRVQVHRASARTIVLLWILLLTFAYPVLAYYSEAASSIPPSEGKAMTFLGNYANLNDKGISMSTHYNYQLFAFVSACVNLRDRPFPPNINDTYTEIVLFRKTAYFEISMKTEFSFTNNSYVRTHNLIIKSPAFNKIYDNPTSELFIRART
jgi:hypothetical protein